MNRKVLLVSHQLRGLERCVCISFIILSALQCYCWVVVLVLQYYYKPEDLKKLSPSSYKHALLIAFAKTFVDELFNAAQFHQIHLAVVVFVIRLGAMFCHELAEVITVHLITRVLVINGVDKAHRLVERG